MRPARTPSPSVRARRPSLRCPTALDRRRARPAAPRDRLAPQALQNRLNPIASVQVGILSCDGLGALANSAGLAINKVSTIAINDHDTLHERARVLGGDRYGSIWIDRDGREHHDPGYSDWRVNTFPDMPALPRENPVRIRLRTLDVRLPIDVTHAAFDKALTEALSSARIDLWAKAPGGHAWCIERRIDPGRFVRFSDVWMGGIRPTRFPAQELLRIMPRLQTNLLIAVVEEVVLRLSGWHGPARSEALSPALLESPGRRGAGG